MFEAVLEPAAEARALAIGSIQVLDPTPPGIKPGSWTLPRKTTTATKGAVSDG